MNTASSLTPQSANKRRKNERNTSKIEQIQTNILSTARVDRTSSTTLSDSSLTSGRIEVTDERTNASSNTPRERWIRNVATPELKQTLGPHGVLFQLVTADCKQHGGGDPDVIADNLVLGNIIELSKEEVQRMLGDNTYYVKCLKKWMGSADSSWVNNILVNKTTPTDPEVVQAQEQAIAKIKEEKEQLEKSQMELQKRRELLSGTEAEIKKCCTTKEVDAILSCMPPALIILPGEEASKLKRMPEDDWSPPQQRGAQGHVPKKPKASEEKKKQRRITGTLPVPGLPTESDLG